MNIKFPSLPSRYEDLDVSYRGRLIPDTKLLSIINDAYKSMQISGGIRFLPIYGESGAGKSSSARELSTHMPILKTFELARHEVEDKEALMGKIISENKENPKKLLVAIIDQYEENVVGKERIPTQFVEYISLLDRGEQRIPIIFIWLTTSKDFKDLLVNATTRNQRILLDRNFIVSGPQKEEWCRIIEETFSFHNAEKPLADYGVIKEDIERISRDSNTIGAAIERVGTSLAHNVPDLQKISDYQVIMFWPVADASRSQRILQFTKPREGYKLNWDAWFNELNKEDKLQLPLSGMNRTRLYFDVRLIPVRVADLHKLCLYLDQEDVPLAETYLKRFKKTHFYHVVSNSWETYDYNPIRERESDRSREAADWYATVNDKPTLLGRRIACIFRACGINATYEETIKSEFSSVRADVYIERSGTDKAKLIMELKAFSSANTMPSNIKEAIKVTLRRHAQFAGFIERQ